MNWNRKIKLSNFEVYGNDTCLNENFIYYNDLTCVEINKKYIKYYKLENPFSLDVSINLYRKILHRDNGPAIEYPDGTKHWYQNGELYRTDGPAVENINGDKFWYLNGIKLTWVQIFKQRLKQLFL